jgi:hypothetical protein
MKSATRTPLKHPTRGACRHAHREVYRREDVSVAPAMPITGGLRDPGAEHPRPLLRRDAWTSLDGPWAFALDPEARWHRPTDVVYDAEIQVPFAPESPASGIGDTSFYRSCWYRRAVALPAPAPGARLLLHFGAVDHRATVWVNGAEVARHEGGYTPFSADVTDVLVPDGDQEIVVRAVDDPLDLEQPRGKQDWKAEPHSIWYPRTTGIWQTVWAEEVPASHVAEVGWRASVPEWTLDLAVRLGGEPRPGLRLEVTLRAGDRVLVEDRYSFEQGQLRRRILLKDPGVGDERRALAWRPEHPNLIQAELVLVDADGARLDEVASYTAMRSVRIEDDQLLLNERPYPQRLVLDQGYWPETGMTPPSVEALRRDVELAKALGFNGVRKHQKIEDPRFLRLADELGLLVWVEMPSAYAFSARAARRRTHEWTRIVEVYRSHPCVVAWVPFNESWGVPDLPHAPEQRNLVAALYHLTKALDPTRPVVGNDGWEAVASDVLGVHDYDHPAVLGVRWAQLPDELLAAERPFGRRVLLEGATVGGRPMVLSEFGGVTMTEGSQGPTTWGYDRAPDADAFLRRYRELLDVVRSLPRLCGFCYTQFTDTYQEANGLLRADRTPKAPLEEIAAITRGDPSIVERTIAAQQAAHHGQLDVLTNGH